MTHFLEFFPHPGLVESLEAEELAGIVLEYMASPGQANQDFSMLSFLGRCTGRETMHLREPLCEAWQWLEKEGLIAQKPLIPNVGNLVYITKKGRRHVSPADFKKYLKAQLLPQSLLRPDLARKIFTSFVRGDYDTAVFQSFKELEVSIRSAGGFSPTDIGVDLARRAFKPNEGPLADKQSPIGEQEALMHLMAGALGSYKNPSSHRHVALDAEQAAEMITLANHLIGIVSRRST